MRCLRTVYLAFTEKQISGMYTASMNDQVQKTNLTTPAVDLLNSKPRTSQTEIQDTFKQMLSAMMMQSFMPSMGEDSNASGMPMMTMMMALLEKMISEQATAETETQNAPLQHGQWGVGDPNVGAGIMPGFPGATGAASRAEPYGMPVNGRISQGSRPGHVALDFAVPVGTPIKSTMDGRVVYAGWNNEGYGNLVIVENGPYRTYYAHLSEIPVVVGQDIAAGSVIGLSGNTGNSTGPHLHYEIRKNMVHIDPTQVTLNPDAGGGNIYA